MVKKKKKASLSTVNNSKSGDESPNSNVHIVEPASVGLLQTPIGTPRDDSDSGVSGGSSSFSNFGYSGAGASSGNLFQGGATSAMAASPFAPGSPGGSKLLGLCPTVLRLEQDVTVESVSELESGDMIYVHGIPVNSSEMSEKQRNEHARQLAEREQTEEWARSVAQLADHDLPAAVKALASHLSSITTSLEKNTEYLAGLSLQLTQSEARSRAQLYELLVSTPLSRSPSSATAPRPAIVMGSGNVTSHGSSVGNGGSSHGNTSFHAVDTRSDGGGTNNRSSSSARRRQVGGGGGGSGEGGHKRAPGSSSSSKTSNSSTNRSKAGPASAVGADSSNGRVSGKSGSAALLSDTQSSVSSGKRTSSLAVVGSNNSAKNVAGGGQLSGNAATAAVVGDGGGDKNDVAAASGFGEVDTGSALFPIVSHPHSKYTRAYAHLQCLQTFTGHSGPIWCLKVTSDILISGSADETIKLWDLSTLRLICTLTGHTGIVHALGVWRGKYLFSGSADKCLRIWDLNESERKCINALYCHDNTICELVVNDSHLFTGSYNEVKVWSLMEKFSSQKWRPIHVLSGHKHWVYSMVFYNRFLICGSHNMLKVWDVEKFEEVRTINTTHGKSVYSLAVAGNYLLSGTYENTVNVYHLESFKECKTLMEHQACVLSLAVAGQYFFSGSYDTTIKVWNNDTLQCIDTLYQQGKVEALVTARDYLISGGTDSSIKVWGLKKINKEDE